MIIAFIAGMVALTLALWPVQSSEVGDANASFTVPAISVSCGSVISPKQPFDFSIADVLACKTARDRQADYVAAAAVPAGIVLALLILFTIVDGIGSALGHGVRFTSRMTGRAIGNVRSRRSQAVAQWPWPPPSPPKAKRFGR